MEKEIWLPIENTNNCFFVSNMGRFKNVNGELLHLAKRKKTEYLGVYFLGKSRLAHRIVAKYFVPNPENKPEVNHKFGDKSDIRACVLEWSTRKENMAHAYEVLQIHKTERRKAHMVKLHELQRISIIRIDSKTNASFRYDSMTDAEADGFFKSNISACINGKLKQYKGFKWELAAQKNHDEAQVSVRWPVK